MEQSREEILANFQACTGIEDIAAALNVLENSNWDLMRAVNHAMKFDAPVVEVAMDQDPDVEIINDFKSPPQNSSRMHTTRSFTRSLASQTPEASTSNPCLNTSRLLKFTIHYEEKTVNFKIADSSTIVDLKHMIAAKVNVPVCRQLLSGWVQTPQNDNVTLASLSLPLENTLFLISAISTGVEESDSDVAERLFRSYCLNIRDESSNKTYKLNFRGTKTILEVKTDVYNITDIPVRHQVWTGWPNAYDDSTCLAAAGLSYPTHNLTVKRSVSNARHAAKDSNATPQNKHKKILEDLVDSDSSVEEFEDASETFNIEDDVFIDNVGSRKIEPLIPVNIEDEAIGCIHFSERFTARYGGIHPMFFTGTLEDAIKEACGKPAKDRRLLAVYLHHDNSVLSNVFCTQLLCFESVLQMFEANFVVWGWDMTYELNKNMLLQSLNNNLGPLAATPIRSTSTDKFPVLMLIMRMRSATEVFAVIHGDVGVNELLGSLMEAVEVWSEQQQIEMREEQERADRELVMREQDEAYRESLEADRAKEAAKREQEALEEEERRKQEQMRLETEAKKEKQRQTLISSLPAEPNETSGETIARIRFRLPKGQMLDRRFLTSESLQVLLDFLTVKGYPPEEYKVISSWPRRDLTTVDSQQTLMELKLYPQETVMIEER